MGFIQKTGKQIASSSIFGDVYWSKEGGLEEKKYVFSEGNRLLERWKSDFTEFKIFELGFGAGLNFFQTWKEWISETRNGKFLHYISTEKYPLQKEEIQLVLEDFPEIEIYVKEFLDVYSFPEKGIHRFIFAEQKIELSLCIGEGLYYLQNLNGNIDAFFLDGFSPSKNPDLWSEEIFKEMYSHSHESTTFSTYSVSRSVKDNSTKAGFQIQTKKGFGTKKEMLIGFIEESKTVDHKYPYYRNSDNKLYYQIKKFFPTSKSTAIIIGAGLAGASVSYQLARRNIPSLLIDEKESHAMGASGNPVGIFSPTLTANPTPASRLSLIAYQYLYRELIHLEKKNQLNSFQRKGVFQHIGSEEEKDRVKKAIRHHPLSEASARIEKKSIHWKNQSIEFEGLFLPQAGYLSPRDFIQSLLNIASSQSNTMFNTKVTNIQYNSGIWTVFDSQDKKIASSEILILANSSGINQFPETSWLQMQKIRGQICIVPKDHFPLKLDFVFTHDDGYIIETDHFYCIGATYNNQDFSEELNPSHNKLLASRLQSILPDIDIDSFARFSGRVGFRSVCNDRIPIVGPVPNKDFFIKSYPNPKQSKGKFPLPQYMDGLYVLGGLGSRGITYGLYFADFLASLLKGSEIVWEKDLVESILPSRFLIRDLVKGGKI
jgi:tRNA 5-methylaminomethyl-2-thiouridine biosynthesis bifunctional protein